MNGNTSSISYDQFYNIRLDNFYQHVAEVLSDFNYSFHHNVSEEPEARRIETWRSTKDENEIALVWIEVIKSGNDIDPFIATDVLRTMNDENLTRLFFFTNTDLNDDQRDMLEGTNHFVFTPSELVETLIALEEKKSSQETSRRKSVKTPSGFAMIKNYLKSHEMSKDRYPVRTSRVIELARRYRDLSTSVLDEMQEMERMDIISQDLRDRYRRIQQELLPELHRVAMFQFPPPFAHLKNQFFGLIEHLIIYIGAIVEYEAEEDVRKNREHVETLLTDLLDIDNDMENFTRRIFRKSEKIAIRLIIASSVVIIMSALLYIMIK